MKRIIFIAALLPLWGYGQLDFDTALDVVGNRIANKVYLQEKKKVAVADLLDLEGNSNNLGRLIAEELTISLLKHSRDFEVMDRAHLEAIFEEHKLAMGGLMNDSSLIELGKMESVEVVITGTIAKVGDRYKVTIKALDTESAMIIAADKEYFYSEPYLDEYFGIETPIIKPIDPPRVADCYGSDMAYISFHNGSAQPVMLILRSPFPSDKSINEQSVRIESGMSEDKIPIHAGIVEYEVRHLKTTQTLNEGTIYLEQCADVQINF